MQEFMSMVLFSASGVVVTVKIVLMTLAAIIIISLFIKNLIRIMILFSFIVVCAVAFDIPLDGKVLGGINTFMTENNYMSSAKDFLIDLMRKFE